MEGTVSTATKQSLNFRDAIWPIIIQIEGIRHSSVEIKNLLEQNLKKEMEGFFSPLY